MTPIARTASAADSNQRAAYELELSRRDAMITALQRELAELKATNAGLAERYEQAVKELCYASTNGLHMMHERVDALATSAGERKGEVE